MKRLGLIINPIAGMGGKVGLKGTDGENTLNKAISLGASKISPEKAKIALQYIKDNVDGLEIITYPGDMGENECTELEITPTIIGHIAAGSTTGIDTEMAASDMLKEEVALILFAGGDGTARNIYNSVKDNVPVIGIPTGVKIHSAVFGTNPLNAGKVVVDFFHNRSVEIRGSEVMDIDEEAFRSGKVVAKLYGYMHVPYKQEYVQSLKAGCIYSDNICLEGIADYIIDNMKKEYIYLIGPGTTTRKILQKMNLPNSLLGVDIVKNGELIKNDANEREILEIVECNKFKIIVTLIGGQGYIFGRGNQQIGPNVIKSAGKENIIIVSTPNKLIDLKGNPLLVDTGDEYTDNMLQGFYRVIVGYDETYIYKCK